MIVNDFKRQRRTMPGRGPGSGQDLEAYGTHGASCRRCGRPIGRRIQAHPGTSRAPTLASPSGARNAGPCPADQTPAFEVEMGRELR
jgi:hypothetical protein